MAKKSAQAQKPDKPPVVMIHGAFCGPWAWEGYAAQFRAAGYVVHTPALRFHDLPRAPEALATTSLADYVADLEDLIAHLPAPPILVGHSMGGLLAQMLAARTRIAALVLLAPSAPWGVAPATLFEIAAAQSMLLQPGFWNQVLTPNRDIAFAHSLDQMPRAARNATFDRFVAESGRAMFEVMHWGLDMNRASEIDPEKVQCPVLLISGSEDRINAPGTVARVAALYPGRATHQDIPGMGHWLIGEKGWEAIAGGAVSWLEAHAL